MRKNYYEYFIPIILLSILGVIAIYFSRNSVNNYNAFFIRQIIFLCVGIGLLFFFKCINFNYIKKYSLLIYIVSIFLLIYVLFFGKVINGSRSWINLFGISIQPSEFAKIGLLLCLDKYIETKYGFIKNISDIYLLKNHKEDLIRLEGYGNKSMNAIGQEIRFVEQICAEKYTNVLL